MSKNIKVVLKSLETIINETKAPVSVDGEGKITRIGQHPIIVEEMIPFFLSGELMEIPYTKVPQSIFNAHSWSWEPSWVAEFIEPTPEVVVEEETEVTMSSKEFRGAKGESLEVAMSCCGCPLLFLRVEDEDSVKRVSFHVNGVEEAEAITQTIMDVVSGCSMKPVTFTGKYSGESLKVRKACSGEPMLIIDNEDDGSEVFHIMGGEKDAKRINELIMGVYNR